MFTLYKNKGDKGDSNNYRGISLLSVAGKIFCTVLPPEGKRSGERKPPTFHPPRPRTICVQPDKYWHGFEGNLGENAKRQGGARMGLSERYDAILS